MSVLVVGGGPSGLIVTKEAAKAGMDVTVLEEHNEIGTPVHCAGLVSTDGLARLDVHPNKCVLNTVRGARFYSPGGLSVQVEADRPKAYVIDRRLFDKTLAAQAAKEGGRIILGQRVKHIASRQDRVVAVLAGRREQVNGDAVAIAEGARCLLTRGLKIGVPTGVLQAAQLEVAGIDLDPEFVELHFGRDLAPGLFAWKIPLSSDVARVGLACRGSAYPRLKRFVEREFGKRWRTVNQSFGLLMTGGPIGKTFGDRFVVVGDAAGQTKPTTGGGIVIGGLCAYHAARALQHASGEGNWSAAALKRYEDGWKREVGKELKLMLTARRILNMISDKAMDKLFQIAIKEGLAERVLAEGDMDFQSPALLSLIKQRSILKVIFEIARDLIKSIGLPKE